MKNSRKVYSTESGRLCPKCEQPIDSCQCQQQGYETPAPGSTVKIKRETKGRKGKGVTLIENIPVSEGDLAKLAKTIKAKCSSGGTVKSGVIEIQGDHRQAIKEYLQGQGYNVKLAGG
ncbi:MAG: stress response translation initiation inhibitor YciH [Pseudohongiellaceae bacterium]|nr:stress response translation initiation inhibitor YciH [Pseudohongiellaceae bacterium]